MAKQIAVVLSQAPRQNPARRDFEETLVAQLLMEDGLEVTIVPHLEQLDEHSTGRLCLEGVAGDMILLASQPPLESDRQLRQLGVGGRFGRTRQTADLPADQLPQDPGPRTLYCVDLEGWGDVAAARKEVLRIRDEALRSVVLLADFTSGAGSLLPLAAPPAPGRSAAAAGDSAVSPAQPPGASATSSRPPGRRDSEPEDELDRELDDLMDEFEQW